MLDVWYLLHSGPGLVWSEQVLDVEGKLSDDRLGCRRKKSVLLNRNLLHLMMTTLYSKYINDQLHVDCGWSLQGQ